MRKKAVTLIELIVALSLLGVVVLGAMSFDRASRGLLLSTERQTAVVNDVAFVNDHIARMGFTAIGDINHPAIYTGVAPASAGGGTMYFLQQDTNGNGRWEPGTDGIVGYGQQGNTAIYCPNAACPNPQVLANNVIANGFRTVVVGGGCAWVTTTVQSHGQTSSMQSYIYMPGWSTT